MNKIDEALDSMTAAELAELEIEVTKQAADAKAAFHFQSGAKLAQEAVELFKTTGEISPLFSLLSPAKVAAEPGSIEAELDKCSAEQLATIEAELDKEAEQRASQEYAARYFDMGVKMAQEYVAAIKKEAAPKMPPARIPKAPKLGPPAAAAPKPESMGKRVGGFIDSHPMASGAIAGGVGLMAAQHMMGDKR